MAITCAPLAAQTGPGFGSLKCEQETDPVGIETPSPRFSWQLVSPERGCRQTAYRIVVAGTEKDAAAGRATMWDSGKVPGEQSLLIPYNGQPLEAADWASSSCFSTARRRATTSSIRPGPSSIRRRNTFRST